MASFIVYGAERNPQESKLKICGSASTWLLPKGKIGCQTTGRAGQKKPGPGTGMQTNSVWLKACRRRQRRGDADDN